MWYLLGFIALCVLAVWMCSLCCPNMYECVECQTPSYVNHGGFCSSCAGKYANSKEGSSVSEDAERDVIRDVNPTDGAVADEMEVVRRDADARIAEQTFCEYAEESGYVNLGEWIQKHYDISERSSDEQQC